jgi:hypothetical protein
MKAAESKSLPDVAADSEPGFLACFDLQNIAKASLAESAKRESR